MVQRAEKVDKTTGTEVTAPNISSDQVMAGGQKAATQYGKSAKLDDAFPPTNALLAQINADENKDLWHKEPSHKTYFDRERALVAKLTDKEKEDINGIVNAIHKSAKAAESGVSNPANAAIGDAVKKFADNPARLKELQDVIKLELEVKHMANNYQVDVMPYWDKDKNPFAALVITDMKAKDRKKGTFGISTDGRRVQGKLLDFLYD
jgi:hypothetical protein